MRGMKKRTRKVSSLTVEQASLKESLRSGVAVRNRLAEVNKLGTEPAQKASYAVEGWKKASNPTDILCQSEGALLSQLIASLSNDSTNGRSSVQYSASQLKCMEVLLKKIWERKKATTDKSNQIRTIIVDIPRPSNRSPRPDMVLPKEVIDAKCPPKPR